MAVAARHCLGDDMANITLVDDDENIVTSVSMALESHGHTVKSYYDGAAGLSALESDPPDLLNIYGLTKRVGEDYCLLFDKNFG